MGLLPRPWAAVLRLAVLGTGLLVLSAMLPLGADANPGGALAERSAVPAPVWTEVHPSTSVPTARQFYGMADDPALGSLVLFGGLDQNSLPLGDTWEFNSTGWHKPALTTSPTPRWNDGLVYDPALRGVLLFGGQNESGSLNDTWVFTATGWHELFPLHSPPPVGSSQLVYDSADGYALLPYASPGASRIDAVWTFNDTDWSNITASVGTTPPNVWLDSAYDSVGGMAVFYGGSRGCGTPAEGVGLTWTYAHGVYANVTGTQSVTPENVLPSLSMAYDPVLTGVVMFSGYTLACVATNTTYLFQNGSWVNLTSEVGASPPPRWNARLAYLPGVGDVLFSGNEAPIGGVTSLGDDTWVLAVPPPAEHTVTFIEFGLPTGTRWSVTLNETSNSSTGAMITFQEVSGSYAYLVGGISGYTAAPRSGTVTVPGPGAAVSVVFTANSTTSSQPSNASSSNDFLEGMLVGGVIVGALMGAIWFLRPRKPASVAPP